MVSDLGVHLPNLKRKWVDRENWRFRSRLVGGVLRSVRMTFSVQDDFCG